LSYIDLYFTTATVRDWKHLFGVDRYKQILIDSLAFLARERCVQVYAFVIMPNHFHLVWQLVGAQDLPRVQQRLLKFVAQQIKFDLLERHPDLLEQYKVQRKDRQYQFFKERPLSVPIYSDAVAQQKIEYVHRNPLQPRWALAAAPEDYAWSSAAFYGRADLHWSFLTHFWYGADWPPPF
jgi:putative transposase